MRKQKVTLFFAKLTALALFVFGAIFIIKFAWSDTTNILLLVVGVLMVLASYNLGKLLIKIKVY